MEYNKYTLSFQGNGFDYFKIQLVNIILTIVTLGLYYPWAKARTLNYMYGQTLFQGQPFVFTGTGNEMFKGYIKALGIIIVIYGIGVFIALSNIWGHGGTQLVLLALYLLLFLIMPLAIHGSYRYRFAKTVWSGIRFGYSGDKTELIKIFIKGLFLTIITFGIYGAWFSMNLRRYLLCHIRIGNARFSYKGVGDEYFWLNVKGYFLTLFTVGIYIFWWQKELFAYFTDNLRLTKDDQTMLVKSNATGVDFAGLIIVNLLLLVFTLGLATPWIVVRTMRFVFNHIELDGTIQFDQLRQEQNDFSDATGEDIADFFDFGFVI